MTPPSSWGLSEVQPWRRCGESARVRTFLSRGSERIGSPTEEKRDEYVDTRGGGETGPHRGDHRRELAGAAECAVRPGVHGLPAERDGHHGDRRAPARRVAERPGARARPPRAGRGEPVPRRQLP